METEDKELLLKDLCARLPYDTMVHGVYAHQNFDFDTVLTLSDIEWFQMCVAEVKPYLFPLSSMTEEQRKNWFKESNVNYDCEFHIEPTISIDFCHLSIDWLNAHHFDYRGLIEKGLAIDCTDLKIY